MFLCLTPQLFDKPAKQLIFVAWHFKVPINKIPEIRMEKSSNLPDNIDAHFLGSAFLSGSGNISRTDPEHLLQISNANAVLLRKIVDVFDQQAVIEIRDGTIVFLNGILLFLKEL